MTKPNKTTCPCGGQCTCKKQKLPVYLDTETTGLWADMGDEMLEIAIVEQDGSVLLNTFVKPKHKRHWPDAMAVHHITPNMVKDAPTLDDIADQIIDALVGRTVYIWNAPFDAQFVGFALEYAKETVCAMREFGNFIERTQPHNASHSGRYKLDRTAHDLGVEIDGKPHRALTDVITTIHVHQAWLKLDQQNSDKQLAGNINTPPYQEQP